MNLVFAKILLQVKSYSSTIDFIFFQRKRINISFNSRCSGEFACATKRLFTNGGMVLWELLEQKRPFEGKNPQQIIMRVLQGNEGEKIDESITPPTLQQLLKQCWSSPDDRPSAKEVFNALKGLSQKELNSFPRPI